MSNSEIIDVLELTAKLLDLHDKDEIRAKTYTSAAFNISRLENELNTLAKPDILALRGIGRLLAANIEEIISTGTLAELSELMEQTPQGLFDIFKVKGLGVKKIKTLWKTLGIDNVNELRIACENGTIAAEKGFGEKTQVSILESLDYIKAQQGKLRIDGAEILAEEILRHIKTLYSEADIIGQVPRFLETVDLLQFYVVKEGFGGIKLNEEFFRQDLQNSSPIKWSGFFMEYQIPLEIFKISAKDKVKTSLIYGSHENHLKFVNKEGVNLLSHINQNSFTTESDAYQKFGFPYILPELREGHGEFEWIESNSSDTLVTWESLKGTLHNHSTYSDGSHTLKQMADYAREIGLSYFGIADHSQTATYAKGLTPERVIQQHKEIDLLNSEYTDFKIVKGIESDILTNGDLDYEPEVLARFDYVVASVHAVLNMDIEKATDRLIKAIENPYTSILGHMTGRILLSRNGYPVHVNKIIDACAANKVSIELNSSPYRLDIDWRYLPLCLEKGIKIALNPDAHEMLGLLDMKYGVKVARKGFLTKNMTLNALPLPELLTYFKK